MEFYELLEQWFARNGRDLPWRNTRDPYRVWVSEIILQQTRVEQGRDYYIRFLKAFPTVGQLAAASQDSVMRQWEGLGYYSRARNLHAAARQVVEAGKFPADYAGLRSLKGVGDYTAAAIASFCYDEPRAVVDGNVYRVLSRCFGITTPIDTTQGRREFAEMADMLLDRQRPALYNQAIMDFGALHCTPKSPLCSTCPMEAMCKAREWGRVGELPVKSKRTAVAIRHLVYFILEEEHGSFLIRRREAGDIWKGLYEPLLLEMQHEADSDEAMAALGNWLSENAGAWGEEVDLHLKESVQGLRHQLTHRLLLADAYRVRARGCDAERCKAPEGYRWVSRDELVELAAPRLVNRIYEHFGMAE